MATKGPKNSENLRSRTAKPDALPDDFPSELLGDFAQLDKVTEGNLGTIAGLATRGGGYFGFSITDDGGSAKLAIRHALVSFEKRVYRLADLHGLLAYSVRKLRGE